MRAERQNTTVLPVSTRALTQQRSELEARLLAYRCGWLELDEIKIRKLEKALRGVLHKLGTDDVLATALLEH